uniref:Uncharacterized protein n=1 Tax=Graphocephala atropunctata TaxID=36148 RepID=A0A1B6LHC1_9HEMI
MADILKNKKYDILDQIVEQIHVDCIKIDNEERKCLVERVEKVICAFTDKMKACDKTFNEIFSRINYTGSFYDGVRVGEATEFDLNLVLKPKLKMEPYKKECGKGFVKIKIENYDSIGLPIKDWIVNGFLKPDRVKQWLEGVVKITLTKISNRVENCELKLVKSGPAMTLKVTSNVSPTKEISIDLVPVIEFPGTMWPSLPKKSKEILNGGHGQSWFAVPKLELAWRMSFPTQEKFILKDLMYLKHTLRLMKKVRDELGINKVASYYIKTLFLWEVERSEDPKTTWSTNRRGPLFMYMLVQFRDALKEKKIPFYWDQEVNLIGELRDGNIKNSYDKLNKFIKQIEKHVDDQNSDQLRVLFAKELNKTKANEGITVASPPRVPSPPRIPSPPRVASPTSVASPPVVSKSEQQQATSCVFQ